MHEKFTSAYNPKNTEERIYELWEESGYFNPDVCVEKGICSIDAETFSIVLPPPNVTGRLHVGHSMMLAVEDTMVRYNRMRKRKTLWIPGTDHAAIATEAKVSDQLYKKEKKTRHDLGRDEFLKRVETYALESHDTIVDQVKRMGASLDWSREAYTLDEKREVAVRTAFKRMYDEKLIYRGHRIVNWDPKLQTNVSDDEIEWIEETVPFYYLKYGPFIIGTARPETKFGDKYVVMHPSDSRYKDYAHGQEIELEWINGKIKATVVKDEAIDMEFGTGVMTITPWHDMTDFDIAERHDLDKEQIIDLKGRLLPIAGEFAGKHISKARAEIVKRLEEKGLVEKIDEKYIHRIATNSRGGGVIEPQIREQWFVDVNKEFELKRSGIEGLPAGSKTTLKTLMLHVVKNNQIDIIPERFEKVYYHWIENLRDWCISRQIWFGHRIPVWYHENKCIPIPGREDEVSQCEMLVVSAEEPKCEHCSAKYVQDPDTLDTWFSSGLWTFSTLGWPEKTNDLETYHPTSILETGYDIIFFWVARMILMGGYLIGDVPFKTVYLHGLVRDEKGRKMSKSLENIIDPLDLIDQYGADATRMSLIVGVGPGNDSNLSIDKVRAYKHFANKLWNVTRFVLMNVENMEFGSTPELLPEDAAALLELEKITSEVTDDIENYRFYLAAEKLYHYVWHTLADKLLEERKERLQEEDPIPRQSAQYTLYTILTTCLKLLHPFMPFITEEIWQDMPHKDRDILMIESWPTA